MAGIKISALPAATDVVATDVAPLVSGGVTTKATPAQMVAAALNQTPVAIAQGGTGADTAAVARTNLGVPSTTGAGASGTWGIGISGNAATATTANTASSATNATNATNLTGGAAGSLPRQTNAGVTSMLPIGSNGQVLKVVGSTIAWAAEGGGAALVGRTDSATPFETSLGYQANLNGTGVNNSCLGYQAGYGLTTGSNNTLIGKNAGDNITVGSYNTGVGDSALGGTGSNNTALGYYAGAALTTGASNVFIGANAGDSATATSFAVAIGQSALGQATTSTGTVAIGGNCLSALTTGSSNTCIGYFSGSSLVDGNTNVAVGLNSLRNSVSGASNVAIGMNAMQLSTGNGNTVIGFNSGDAMTSANNTVALGYNAAGSVTTGNANTCIGYQSGNTLTVGGNNTFIGIGSGSQVTTGSNNTIVGGYTGAAALTKNVVLSDGTGVVRQQFNQNGAMSFDGTNYGQPGQVLVSNTTNSAPSWVYPAIWDSIYVNGNFTTGPDKEVYLWNCSDTNGIATLPNATTNSGQMVIIKRADTNTSNTLTVNTTNGQLIDGATTDSISTLNAVTYFAYGGAWYIINVYNKTTPSLPAPQLTSTMGGDGDAFVTFTPIEGATGYDVLVDPNGN